MKQKILDVLYVIDMTSSQYITKINNKKENNEIELPSLIEKFEIDVVSMPIKSDFDIKLALREKFLIVEKLLEAHLLAVANVKCGNITGRGFATNVCDNHHNWTKGTNFNNTRCDISSICGERTAILGAYNKALEQYSKPENVLSDFNFKIKYLCMATHVPLYDEQKTIAPCEDCLSWLNTNRFFDDNTMIFSFERDKNDILKLHVSKLSNLLPYRNALTSTKFSASKDIELSIEAQKVILDKKIEYNKILDLILETKKRYDENNFATVSKQNVACSILANDEIFSSSKIDWTRRWNVEPLELSSAKAIEKFGQNTKIKAICYFGDEFVNNNQKLNDGVVSIKSLGRIRQKYATNDTLLILNYEDKVKIMTIAQYLPKKFVQGYKI